LVEALESVFLEVTKSWILTRLVMVLPMMPLSHVNGASPHNFDLWFITTIRIIGV
jgi:hypothetical protein